MAVYFEPYRKPWWTDILGAFLMDQVGQMGDRTRRAKEVEGQRAFSSAFSDLMQNNPDMDPTQLYAQAVGLPGFNYMDERGLKMIDQGVADAREKAKKKTFFDAMQGDPRLNLFEAMTTGLVDPKFLMPELKQQTIDAGDRVMQGSINPYTGELAGGAWGEILKGLSPDVAEQTAAQRYATDVGAGNVRAQTAAQIRAAEIAAQGRGTQMMVGKDGNYYWVNQGQEPVPVGDASLGLMPPPNKNDPRDPMRLNATDTIKLFDTLRTMGEPEPKDPGYEFYKDVEAKVQFILDGVSETVMDQMAALYGGFWEARKAYMKTKGGGKEKEEIPKLSGYRH